MKKGIGLITLVITIIIMIIIAGAVIVSLSNSSIFDQATKTIFVSDIKTIMEEYNIYAAFYIADGNDIHELNVPVGSVKDVVKALPDDSIYAEKIAIVNGKLTYMVNVKDKADVERANWACEAGMNVNGFTGCSDIEYVEPDYRKQGTIYYNIPDLTGFNPETTYYVTYDSNGIETIGEPISKKAPKGWYDYEHKMWANIVTINNDLATYLVWIPRYAYQVVGASSSDQADKKVDIRFVDNDNVYTAEDGTKITYNDTEPTFDENENQTNYVLPSSFDVNMGTEENPDIKHLSGFWISKYEVQDVALTNVNTSIGTNFIEITGMTTGASKFDYYLDGVLKQANGSSRYKYEGLEHDKTYTVKIVARDGNGNEAGSFIKEYTTLGENTNGIAMLPADTYSDKIVIYSTTLTDLANQNNVKTYEFYLDDELKATNSTGAYPFEGLAKETTYKVTVKIKDTGIYYGEYTRTLTTTGVPTYGEANAPELGTLLKHGVYYLTWNADGSENRKEVVDENGNLVAAPSDWYDYDNKVWANIIVRNEETGAETYLTWIPRYEYKVIGAESSNQADKKVDISFIPSTTLEPTTGYIIPSSFDINMGTEENPDIKHLSGFWISKYEVQDVPVAE